MRNLIRWATTTVTLLLAFVSTICGQTPQRRAITFRDLVSMHRVSDPQISPDARWIASVKG
jgi:hypothetical protein